MARKTFISYKYSEAQNLRDKIISKLGDDAKYYRGEDGYSENLSSYKAETIKNRLSDMIWGTSVTIVILSPQMIFSSWIEWELKYSLRVQSRSGRNSYSNGIVAVIQKDKNTDIYTQIGVDFDPYGWLKKRNLDKSFSYRNELLFPVIYKNRFNKKDSAESSLPRDYIEIVDESTFLKDPNRYIEKAYQKSQFIDSYIITKQ